MKSHNTGLFFCIICTWIGGVQTTPVSECDFVPNCTCSTSDVNYLNLDCKFDADISVMSTLYTGNSSDIRLYRVSLSHNNLTKIPAEFFEKITAMNHLDLSNNALSYLDTTNTTKISTLDLSNNAIISLSNLSIHESQVETLNLTGNTISDIKLTKKMDSVISLNLSHNHISTIPPNAFTNLPNLRNLDLSNNNLVQLSTESFTSLEYLNSLVLSHNKMRKIPALVFAPLTSLVTLDLSNNELESLTPVQMLTLSHRLTNIDLSNNVIRRINTDTFTMMRSLTVPKLAHNPTLGLTINNLSRPATLMICHYRLHCTDAPALWADDRSLTVLKLAHNPMLGLTISNMSLPPTLTHLDLSHCGVTTLGNCGWRMSRLHSLDLTGNSLVCDCRMLWVWEWYEHTTVTDPLRESFKTFKCVQRNGDDVPMLSESPDQLVCGRNSSVCPSIYPKFNIELSVMTSKRTAEVTWTITSEDNATMSQIFGYRVEITSPTTDRSPMLHKFATSYMFGELQDMYNYKFCLNVYTDAATVLRQKCASVYVNSLRVLTGIIAAFVFIIPCCVILVCILIVDKRQKKRRADESEKQAILSAEEEPATRPVFVSSISVVSMTHL